MLVKDGPLYEFYCPQVRWEYIHSIFSVEFIPVSRRCYAKHTRTVSRQIIKHLAFSSGDGETILKRCECMCVCVCPLILLSGHAFF